ncbi:MAG: hypothetical protein HY322_19190 [Betaproteobacteria bacterium]|nr:hypothetical protein [Betaproteobacteria bacterium]
MPLPQLDNLVRTGQLKAEAPAPSEIDGLLRSGNARLKDASNATNSLETGARVEVVELFAFFHDPGVIDWAYRRSLGTSARQLPPLKSTRRGVVAG